VFADGGADFDCGVKATGYGEGDEAEVGTCHHVNDEENNLLDTRDAHFQHGHEATDCLFNPGRGHCVDAAGHVVGHRSHGAGNVFDLGASTEGLATGRDHAGVCACNGDEQTDENEQKEDGPAVDPDLREPSSKAEVWFEV